MTDTRSESMKKHWQDPEYRKMMSEKAKISHSTSEYRKHLSDAQKSSIKVQENMKKIHSDPEIEKKRLMACQTLELKEKQSSSHKNSLKSKLAIKKASEAANIWRHSQKCRDVLHKASCSERNRKQIREIFPRGTTSLERFVYDFLNSQGIQYVSQKCINLSEKHIRVDCLVEPNKIIEVDGKVWHNTKLHPFGRIMDDEKRDSELNKLGYEVLRVYEDDIKHRPDETRDKILKYIKY